MAALLVAAAIGLGAFATRALPPPASETVSTVVRPLPFADGAATERADSSEDAAPAAHLFDSTPNARIRQRDASLAADLLPYVVADPDAVAGHPYHTATVSRSADRQIRMGV